MFLPPPVRDRPRRRRGLTLVELLAVSAILLMMAGTLGSLALSVQNTNRHQFSRGLTLQHGQVLLVRLQRQMQLATANASFPGFASFSTSVGGNSYPDTLVVWRPATAAVDPNGLPRIHELVVYSPNPAAPDELWEITIPSDTRTAPPLTNQAAWLVELDRFRTGANAQRNVLTDLLRIAAPRDHAGKSIGTRAALRFEIQRRPSASQWSSFTSGSTTWDALPWVQGIYGPQVGLAQNWCRFEFQLRPGDEVTHHRDAAIPFFGSAAVYFPLQKP
jgi:prepilin-type N-terminal cleavage/methylation domain-containing protein